MATKFSQTADPAKKTKKKKTGKWSMVYHGLPSFQAPSMSSPLLAKSFSKRVIVNLELRYLCMREEKLLLFFFYHQSTVKNFDVKCTRHKLIIQNLFLVHKTNYLKRKSVMK